MRVSPATPEGAPKVIFAALDASIAAEMEPRFAEAGCAVVTNSSALRMQKRCAAGDSGSESRPRQADRMPGMAKEVGRICGHESKLFGHRIGDRAGSAATGFGLDTVMAVTMQAVSGAGYPGVASLDILGNVIPYIAKEEEKMEEETRKLLGKLNGSGIVLGTFRHERAMQSRRGRRRAHRIGLHQAEARKRSRKKS